MKKLLIFMITVAMIVTMLTACGKKKNNQVEEGKNEAQIESIAPEKEENPEVNEKPEENKKPEVTTKPEENKEPEVTTKPEENKKPEAEEKPQVSVDNRSLDEIMTSILTDVGELPMLMQEPLNSENFEFFTFAKYVEGAEGMVSEPMMTSIAHSVVLVRLPEGADAGAFASEMESKADPRKWICVEAEKVKVTTKGNLVLLVMSTEDRVNAITSNFLKG